MFAIFREVASMHVFCKKEEMLPYMFPKLLHFRNFNATHYPCHYFSKDFIVILKTWGYVTENYVFASAVVV